ncbi:hypothetical protein P3G55_01395 [Leptospira sp. 96542]|nr:hypothetical protein [Leptospira sp. 96542]
MNSFQKIENYLNEKEIERQSLNPNDTKLSDFNLIEISLSELQLNIEELDVLSDSIFSIVKAVVYHFPENIFWDFNFLVRQLAQISKFSSPNFFSTIRSLSIQIIRIFEIFGNHSKIKFRYIHDFIYGYDWLKWMLEKKKDTDDINPFGFDFLNYIESRGLELQALIDQNDSKYPMLNDEYRNPFLFIRTTEEEMNLHKELSRLHQIPIEAWDGFAVPKYDQNYSAIRLEVSKQLGIGKNKMPGSHKE